MDEHSLYDKIRKDARVCPNLVRIQKIHGGQFSSGGTDLMWSSYAGNFAVELKYHPTPKRQSTEVDPYKLCSELQLRAMREMWELNGMSALAVGFMIQSTTFLQFFPGVPPLPAPWYPLLGARKMCDIRKMRQTFDFEHIADILAAFVKYRFGMIEWEDIP